HHHRYQRPHPARPGLLLLNRPRTPCMSAPPQPTVRALPSTSSPRANSWPQAPRPGKDRGPPPAESRNLGSLVRLARNASTCVNLVGATGFEPVTLACKAEYGKEYAQLTGPVHTLDLRKPCPEMP